jgi:nucleoside-specific outer membrane channel protein Tsx
MKRLTLAALGLVALAVPVSAATWSDTYLGYRTGNNFREPAIEQSIQKQIFSLQHVSGNSLGTNFFNVDMLKSDSNDPVNNQTADASARPTSPKGAQEVYVAYRNNLSLGAIFKKKLEFGVVRDVEWTTGFDYNAKNTEFAPSVWKLITGPTLSFKVPGFLTVGLQYYKEWNHNAFGHSFGNTGNNNVVFDGTYQVNVAWGINAPIAQVPGKFKGFAAFTGKKGKDGSNVESKLESLIDMFYMVDFSKVLGAKAGTWQIGPGYEYWNNKFGVPTKAHKDNPFDATVNPKTNTAMIALEYHF